MQPFRYYTELSKKYELTVTPRIRDMGAGVFPRRILYPPQKRSFLLLSFSLPVPEESYERLSEPHLYSGFVAALFESNWYIGEILDETEGEYKISFLETIVRKNSYSFKRPTYADRETVWTSASAIICPVDKPTAKG